jgi:hypothetical protein
MRSIRELVRLRAALAGHPEAATTLESIRQDRAALRSLPDPPLPRDLLDQLEPVLARPMLVESRPGAYRRQYHRRQRRRRVLRVAAAATFLLAGGGGLLLLLTGWPGGAEIEPPRMAAESGTSASTATEAETQDAAPPTVWPPAGAVVHHHSPPALEDASTLLAAASGAAGNDRDRRGGSTAPVPLPFALVVVTDEPAAAEQQVVTRLAGLDGPVAVVRNFSFEEARRIEAQLVARRTRRSEGPGGPLAAGLDPTATPAAVDGDDELIRRVIEQIGRSAADRRADPPSASRRLLGQPAWAATPRHQLLFSGQGATHTVTVPAERLAEVLQRMDDVPSLETALCWLPRQATDPAELAWDEQPELPLDQVRWAADRARIVEHVDRLIAEQPGALVMLPVAVQPPASR